MNEVSPGNRLREAAEALHVFNVTRNLQQPECPVRNFFAPGMWLREMSIPGGVYVVGAVHKHEHLAILSKGSVRLSTEAGIVEFHAPATIHSYPGIKRICHALTDAVITTIHHNPTNTQDMEVLIPETVDCEAADLMGGNRNAQAIQNAITKELLK